RFSIITFFVLFTYVELIDKTNYLNHYYFVSLMSFILCWLPMNRRFALDVALGITKPTNHCSRWYIFVIQLQLACVYFFAGLAKFQPDWLQGMPMKIWLPARADFPIIGSLFKEEITAYVFSYFGLVYDLTIPFFLWWKRTRIWAYLAVIVFHIMTWALFQIGVFPWVMIFCTLIFFSPSWFERWIPINLDASFRKSNRSWLKVLMIAFFIVQIILPFRFLKYNSDLLWKEQGYRFSWRVMLMEKAGSITFRVKDNINGREGIFDHQSYLTQLKEIQMATQPDMILDMAKHIESIMNSQGHTDISVYAEGYVTLNGSGSKAFTKPEVDLLSLEDGYTNRNWIHDWK
ncbi:MAG: HTTM domain-containing protein, partial [Flavobacteriales bacterium]|nr:HTTM domain-containing protein [Flavobacteriales bacterium]